MPKSQHRAAAFSGRTRTSSLVEPLMSTAALTIAAARRPRRLNVTAFFTDPRHFQIATLASLVALHLTRFDLGAGPAQAFTTVASALAAQFVCARLSGNVAFGKTAFDKTQFDWRSPLITGLSLNLLLRSHSPAMWLLAPALGIAAKYVLRIRGKHVFNPATFAIATLLFVSTDVWVSPGQWGNAVWLVLLLVCCGGLVLQRAERADTALAFLGAYAGLLLWRAWSLGDPVEIPLNQLQSGALLLFGFFMITDPRSTPDRRLGRVLFATAVAGLAYWLQFRWQLRPALFFALAAMSPLTPILDWLLPAPRFAWRREPNALTPRP
jgi:Na+-transporting NADH:ubiquinone oxidoreductase subunit NqrB